MQAILRINKLYLAISMWAGLKQVARIAAQIAIRWLIGICLKRL